MMVDHFSWAAYANLLGHLWGVPFSGCHKPTIALITSILPFIHLAMMVDKRIELDEKIECWTDDFVLI